MTVFQEIAVLGLVQSALLVFILIGVSKGHRWRQLLEMQKAVLEQQRGAVACLQAIAEQTGNTYRALEAEAATTDTPEPGPNRHEHWHER